MQEFVGHDTPGGLYARDTMAALAEKGANWRLARVKPGTSRHPEHLTRYPFGRISESSGRA
jgi:glutathione S-transferase